jgi:hypothetical protein
MIALGRMPRFYVDVTTDGQFVPDELGLDLPGGRTQGGAGYGGRDGQRG